jgi:hypothetical protein
MSTDPRPQPVICLLVPRDPVDYGPGIQMDRKRELEQHAGHDRTGCQFIKGLGDLFLGSILGQAPVMVLDACLLGELTFASEAG